MTKDFVGQNLISHLMREAHFAKSRKIKELGYDRGIYAEAMRNSIGGEWGGEQGEGADDGVYEVNCSAAVGFSPQQSECQSHVQPVDFYFPKSLTFLTSCYAKFLPLIDRRR